MFIRLTPDLSHQVIWKGHHCAKTYKNKIIIDKLLMTIEPRQRKNGKTPHRKTLRK